MLKLKQGVALVAVGALAFVAGRVLPASDSALAAQPTKDSKAAQPTKDSKTTQPPKDKATPAAQPGAEHAMPTPGPEHKALEVFIGDFQGGGKMWMQPGSEPMEFSGKVTRKWDMDGWFVIENVTGDPTPGQPAYKGMGIMGYNQVEKRYESAWIENMASYIATANGTYDAAKKTFTFSGEMINPMTQKRAKQRTVIDKSNPDKEIMTGYCNDESGKEYKCFEGTFNRVKK